MKQYTSLNSWIQNCHDLKKLRNVVDIFNPNSKFNQEMRNTVLNKKIIDPNLKKIMISYLEKGRDIPLDILRGTSFTPRSSAICNGIIQAAFSGQKKDFIDDWSSINFIKWAFVFNFITHDINTNLINITELGLLLSKTTENSEDEKTILKQGLINYPPVFRVLSFIEQNPKCNKFNIGQNLGFTNEIGFTSYNTDVLFNAFEFIDKNNKSEINKLKTDSEGTSDKYARDICSWLIKLDLIIEDKELIHGVPLKTYSLNHKGLSFLKSMGHHGSSHKKITRKINLSLLGFGRYNKDKNVKYIRYRRGILLSDILPKFKTFTINEVIYELSKINIFEDEAIIRNDILGFINIGINIHIISEKEDKYLFNDLLDVELQQTIIQKEHDSSSIKFDNLIQKLDKSLQNSIKIINLAYDSSQNKLFETSVMDLLLNTMSFEGDYLGGKSKPDGIILFDYFENNIKKRAAILLDQKSYKDGYSFNANSSDPMRRYLDISFSSKKNNQLLWNKKYDFDNLGFCFVSSFFKGNTEINLKNFSSTGTQTKGSVITAENLLLLCNKIINKEIDNFSLFKLFTSNSEIVFL